MSTAITSTPAADGYRMPAEREAHSGCWMAWPERADNWRLAAEPAQDAYVAVAEAINRSDPVTMAASHAQLERCRAMLSPSVKVVELASDDAWMRDTGPTFVVDARASVRGVDWRFNAWGGAEGGLYSNWDKDELVAAAVLEHEGLARYRAPIVLEGGSIHVDGEGTLLTTEECLLNPNRNPELSRGELERVLSEYLGVEKFIWLGRGVYKDETDGHVDNLACFVRPGLVMLSWCDDRADPQHAISLDALRRLEGARDARGRALEVILVPSPGPLSITQQEAAGVTVAAGTHPRRGGDRLAASYVNYYVGNERVVFPLLDERHDAGVAELLAQSFPEREIVGVQAREILLGGGNIHCITREVPARQQQPT